MGAPAPLMILDTNALAVENQIMGHKNALKQRRHNVRSPYKLDAWKQLLKSSGLTT